MRLKDLEMDSGLANGILKRLIIRYWEEDNNIPPFFRNRTEEQENETDESNLPF